MSEVPLYMVNSFDPIRSAHYFLSLSVPQRLEGNVDQVMCSGSEAGSYLRLIDSCNTQLKTQGPSRTCNKSKEEEKKKGSQCR